jgi:hypothetical protein
MLSSAALVVFEMEWWERRPRVRHPSFATGQISRVSASMLLSGPDCLTSLSDDSASLGPLGPRPWTFQSWALRVGPIRL